MSKLYIFGIGGTGSRVLKSLTMLLASGVECGVDTIVPIIIDRDVSNKDLSRTKLLIEHYMGVHEIAETKGRNKFFKTKIELLDDELCLQLTDNTQKFEEFIGKSTMSKENQALVDMLFSEETLAMDMTAGFQGNPNMGSVVLNQFDHSDIFKAFATDYKEGDKIFIISSIFGGTGASGFPLLRKILQTPNVKSSDGDPLPNWGMINEARIGAISVLPYFVVGPAKDDSMVNSDTFIDKSKAALSYYKTEDRKLDTFYYIADKLTSTYTHSKGGDSQRNKAHFVELAAALAILDFVNPQKASKNFHRNKENKIEKTTYKEFGIKDNVSEIGFDNLAEETKNLLVEPLSRFMLFRNYMKFVFGNQVKYQPYGRKRFDKDFRKKNVVQNLVNLQAKFYEWLEEMDNQSRKFTPFNLDSTGPSDFIKGDLSINEPKDFRYRGWAMMDNQLNRQIGTVAKSLETEKQFMELFFCATEKMINYKS